MLEWLERTKSCDWSHDAWGDLQTSYILKIIFLEKRIS